MPIHHKDMDKDMVKHHIHQIKDMDKDIIK